MSGGYSLLRDLNADDDDDDDDEVQNINGWVASVAGHFNPWFGIVGEVGGNYATVQDPFFETDFDFSIHTFMAGPRFTARGSSAVTPFFHVLVGGARSSVSVLFTEVGSTTELAVQPGGGVDFWVAPNFGIRVGGDYRRIFIEDDNADQFRFHVGVVVSGGRG